MVLVFGVNGACRGCELVNIKTSDIQNCSDDLLLVNLPDTKTKRERSFVIRGDYAKIVKKYQDLRPLNMSSDRFFLNYTKGKCTRQVIGKNKISAIPSQIAEYLKLQDPKLYTGHCYRRTSASLLAESGADMTQIKRHGGWRSDTVAEGYVENSVHNKEKISCCIGNNIKLKLQSHSDNSRQISPQPSTSTQYPQVSSSPTYTEEELQTQLTGTHPKKINTPSSSSTINIPNRNITLSLHNWSNVSNITFNF